VSDHIGRRPILITALVVQALVMLLFTFAGSVDALLAARVLQGLATGAAVGAIGAGLVDLHLTHGPVANAAAAMAGTATGAIGSALLVQLLPAPTQLVYLVMVGIFLAQVLGVVLIAETSPRARGAVRSLKPTIALPRAARGALAIAAPSLVAVWALLGFYASLGPSLTGIVAGSDSTILGGASLFAIAASAALTVLLFRRADPRRFAIAGNVLVVVGVAVVLWAIAEHSIAIFFAGTVIAGAGFGGGFQGGLRTVVPLAAPHERAGVISVVFIISYLSMGVLAIVAGLLVVHETVTTTADQFGAFVIALAALTAAGMTALAARAGRRERASLTPQTPAHAANANPAA
jgi:MFS family permease